MSAINTWIDPLKHKYVKDIIPDNIAMLRFKTDFPGAAFKIIIENRETDIKVEKNSDENGIVGIQTVLANNIPADISAAFFNRYSGIYYFKLFQNDTLIQVGSYEGIYLKFRNAIGYDNVYTIDISTTPITTTSSFDSSFDNSFH